MAKHRQLTEGEVERALRLFIGRQLCDECDMAPADAMAYVLDNEFDLLAAMADAGYAYHAASSTEDDGDGVK